MESEHSQGDLEDNLEKLSQRCDKWEAGWKGWGPNPHDDIDLIRTILQQMKDRQDEINDKLNNLKIQDLIQSPEDYEIPKETDDAKSKETTS